jgi:HD-GYP domain-containing protein (c-di-GMP phosphodiesterase class II)
MTNPIQTPSVDPLPDAQQSLEEARQRESSRLTPRERVVELAIGGGFVAAAVALTLLASSGTPFHWSHAVFAVAAMAAASRVTFEVGSCYTMPLQLVVVPMLFLLPAETLPLWVALSLILGKLFAALFGRRPPERVLLALGDSWFALGPAPDGHDWPVYIAALAAQFAVDFALSSLRESLNTGASAREQISESAWVYLVDALLAPVGFVVALAAVARPWVVLLVLPLTALIAVFARDRRARVDYAVELGRAYRGTAMVLGNVVEADDLYTGVHSVDVVDLSVEVSKQMRLSSAARRNVEFGALLHDVGKITVPKEIINKAGPLDDEEWAIMRRHTIEGQRLLDQVGGFMRDVGVIVRGSHERFDGGGYPDGLAGETIPFESRIVACCDAYSAMTTDRPYREARPVGAALEELRRCSGSQFDPAVVDALIAVVERRLPAEELSPQQPADRKSSAAPALSRA